MPLYVYATSGNKQFLILHVYQSMCPTKKAGRVLSTPSENHEWSDANKNLESVELFTTVFFVEKEREREREAHERLANARLN